MALQNEKNGGHKVFFNSLSSDIRRWPSTKNGLLSWSANFMHLTEEGSYLQFPYLYESHGKSYYHQQHFEFLTMLTRSLM
jgi:hypothetical protein